MDFLVPDWSGGPAAIGAFSTQRAGGVSAAPYGAGAGGGGLNLGDHVGDRIEAVRSNRALLRSFVPAEPVWLSQVHGTKVIDAGNAAGTVEASADGRPQADASIAIRPGVVCAILTADCLPVLFCDLDGRAVGAAHAGWRGLAGGVLENTVACMRAAGATEIAAWLGPAIGPRRFEVGSDVLAAFSVRAPDAATAQATQAAFAPIAGHPGKYLADIYRLARIALAGCGVTRVVGGGFCTVSDPRLYSYRRDKVTGRMATLIWIK